MIVVYETMVGIVTILILGFEILEKFENLDDSVIFKFSVFVIFFPGQGE